MRNDLVYMRIEKARVARTKPTAKTTMVVASRLAGSMKFDVTPSGGFPAGPFKSICNPASAYSAVADADPFDISCTREIETRDCARRTWDGRSSKEKPESGVQ
jgi:hypothetical protein